MGTGFLKVQVHTGDDALPVAGAEIVVSYPDGRVIYRARTDENGNTGTFRLSAPDMKYTLDPNYNRPAYSVYNVDIRADGFVSRHLSNVPIVDTQTTLLPQNLQPLTDENPRMTDDYIDIAPIALLNPAPSRQDMIPPPAIPPAVTPMTVENEIPAPNEIPPGQFRAQPSPAQSPFGGVFIPDYITVHLGTPTNASARNVRVKFTDYIKNVASSEIYPTWPQSSLEANIYAIITFALNRVYTEWYRSRGYNFDITNSTAYDMAYRDGGPVFENISRIVDNIFNTYARRIGFENPFFTQFCNGSTVTCPGLSQWGTVALANQGKSPLEILRYYYPKDLELVQTNNIRGITNSYPGYALSLNSSGADVRRMQNFLNRIRVNFPLIPQISNPNGAFGPDTQAAVRAFQRSFNMTADGVIGRATWNKITQVFTAVARLGELDSEGIRATIGQNPPTVTLSQGSRGENVLQLQFLLNYISTFYPSVPTVIQDSVFGAGTSNSVREFQKTFGLTPDGTVGPATWNKLYAVYKGIQGNVPRPPAVPQPPAAPPPFPGTLLRLGSRGENVRLMQGYLNVINAVYPMFSPKLIADGIFGPLTDAAVRAFQRRFSLVPDGIIGPLTWNKIVEMFLLASGQASTPLEYPGTPLRVGSTGNAVRLMQSFLSDLRKPYPSLPAVNIDGIFGANTQAAVIFFQRLFGLVPDGIIGPDTWYAIIEQRNLAV